MRTPGQRRASLLAACTLLVLTGCGPGEPGTPETPTAPPTTTQPAPQAETRYSVESLTKDGEPVEITGWTYVRLPDTLVGGEIRPSHVCNNPGFEITAVAGHNWTTVQTGIESAEGCGAEAQAVKGAAINTLEGELTVTQTGDRIEITNPPYQLVLGHTQ